MDISGSSSLDSSLVARSTKVTFQSVESALGIQATREESKLELPEMSIQTAGQEGEKDAAKAPELVMVKWKDDNNLLVTGSLKNFDDSTKPVSYLYTLPAGE